MILDKAKMAHEWALKYIEFATGDLDDFVASAWQYADAMQVEADKREDQRIKENEVAMENLREMLGGK